MFRPPWVHSRTVDAYFTLHPEERTFATSHASTLKTETAKSVAAKQERAKR